MKKTIRLKQSGEGKTIFQDDLPSVFELLEEGTKKGIIEEFQHIFYIKAYRRKEAFIGSTILSYDLQKEELIFFDHYQFKAFCDDMNVNITNQI